MNTPVGDKLFQDIWRCAAKFRENRPRDVQKNGGRKKLNKTRMWANAQRDGRPAEYRWRFLFNAAKFCLTPITRMPCSKAAKTRNPLKLPGVPQTNETISVASLSLIHI